jgi:hypothetical protein
VDKLNADSSKAFTDSLQICESGKNPNERDYILMRSDSNLVTVWGAYEGGAYNIYIAKVAAIDTIPNTTVGLNQITTTNRVSIFPNPGEHLLNIVSVADDFNITVSDALGRVMYAGQQTEQRMSISTAEWPAGTYFIRCSTSGHQMPVNKIWMKVK